MEIFNEGDYVLIEGRNHRVVDVDYVLNRLTVYWIACPKEVFEVPINSEMKILTL